MSEFWERFAFYGIRWALVLYIVPPLFIGGRVHHSVRDELVKERGMPPEKARIIPNAVADRAIDSDAAGRLREDLAPPASLHVGLVSSPGSNISRMGAFF